MDWPKTLTLALSVLALSGIVVLNANGMRSDVAAFRAEGAAFRAEASADRRAFQAGMDEYRRDMRLLAERQAHVEGIVQYIATKESNP